ncbi:MAG: thiamine pyrophosphate-dependent dehydrogenase E1 component subunit alpha [Candidatus Omnitrophica bacterium]|nr:thiamine pyrophosphate-dependent dehydrogenase E1 component subunit alpha [Candidatus Omnitrophota bacterium]
MTQNPLPSKEILLELYRRMLLIREVEEKIVQVYPQQEIRCPTHLSIGQEAAASGVTTALRRDDYVFGTHRCHSHYLAKGGDLKQMFSELYGRANGCAKGKGGSMHLVDPSQGMMGSSAIVGGTIPLAAGAALAAKMQGTDRVAVAFFGDGATEEGVFHESLNFAALKKLPVIFVCENNFFATHTPLSARQVIASIADHGKIYGVPGAAVEGVNVIDVYQTAAEMVARARTGGGPSILECRAYRWKEHVGHNYDFHLGYRTKEELDAWINRCPVCFIEKLFLEKKLVSENELGGIRASIRGAIDDAIAFAKASPFPEPEDMMTEIY